MSLGMLLHDLGTYSARSINCEVAFGAAHIPPPQPLPITLYGFTSFPIPRTRPENVPKNVTFWHVFRMSTWSRLLWDRFGAGYEASKWWCSATTGSFFDRLNVFSIVRNHSDPIGMVLGLSENDFLSGSCPIFFGTKKNSTWSGRELAL